MHQGLFKRLGNGAQGPLTEFRKGHIPVNHSSRKGRATTAGANGSRTSPGWMT
jgi:hypothetical protein